ncbi:pre-mRNA cleavage complex 2 protein Pcf11 [Myripristis murdjan]|uniref:Pre-mRNA cleavage complex 2 protein Pcf11 n=1 Tax=Myripristis murdjan TaxID=586833 RepID=A0A667YKN8_9TELE|nr:pre-mRNA cleavage complex 2 protein Pcf11 [Myripristis murdjan]
MDCLVINGYGIDQIGLDLCRSLSAKMDDDAAREDACREYQSSLEDLTFNSKPHINMLTILAEENLHFARDIVAIIEAQISKAPPSEKLPVLYLVDSIVKNVGGEYLAVFAKNLVTSFICVFEKVDENIRKSLFKLRSTWDDVFPLKKLYALDVRVNNLDPAWPIKPLPPTVNASIHVNPRFLKQSEEASSPRATTPQPTPPAPVPAPAPAPVPAPAVSEASLTQEQLIRQQLLAKQKQLLELQQKKIELELEQTKAQLAGGFVLTTPSTANTPPASGSSAPKAASQPGPVIRPWIPPQPEAKPSTRDPRLNRSGPAPGPQPKEQPAGRKDESGTVGPAHTPEKRLPEKSSKPDKSRTLKRDALEEKPKSKSPSPMAKGGQSKNKHAEAESPKMPDVAKKDPRLRKRLQDKSSEARDDEQKEKKRCGDKKEREEATRAAEAQKPKAKLVNGSVNKHERGASAEKAEFKSGGNARTNARKRTRSRSRSRSPSTSSPKRKDRRSPKSRARSSSSSPSPSHKLGKPRRAHGDELQHGKPGREERPALKKNTAESRRNKRPAEERHSESRESHSPRKESKELPHRWRSGWEENKHLKQCEDSSHGKASAQRHKPYNTLPRPTTPRTPKHRLSVDANLQIPEVLNSASKRDLLRRASKRLESGEISQEDFLNVAHQIKQLFQYQEEKQQRSDIWETSGDQQNKFPGKKQPLLATPPSPQSRAHDAMGEAELSYYEHKSKLRRTQVNRRPAGDEWKDEDSPEDGEDAGQGSKQGGRGPAHPPHKYSLPPRDRQGERQSKEREEPPQPAQTPMIEEYNHGKEFPTLKGLRFRRRADPRESSEREWNSPLTERQRYDEREEQKSGYDAPRRFGESRHPDPRRQERLPPSATVVHRNCPSPAGLEAPTRQSPVAGYERERLSPLHQKDSAEMSPIPRFESPNSEHSDDGPLNLDVPPPHPHPPPRSILKAPPRGGPLSSVRQHSDSPGHTPPHEGAHAHSRYDGPGHTGPSRPHPPGRFEGGGPARFDEPSRYNGPHHQGPGRFEGGGAPGHSMPERFDGPGRYDPPITHGPMRGGDSMVRFEGPPHSQGSGRYDGPIGQQPPGRFDGQGPGPAHFDGPMQRFEGPRRFDNNMAPGPGHGPMGFQQQQQQQRPMRFDCPPNQMGPMRFEGPGPMRFEGPGPMRFEGPGQPGPRFEMHQGMPPRYECSPAQQGPPQYGPPHNMQHPMRPLGPPVYENPAPPQQNFNVAAQRFPEPLNPQYPAGPLAFQTPQNQNLQGAGFNMQPAPPFSQPAPGPFYSPAAPAGSMQQQQVNLMANLNQPFLPQNAVPFRQPAPQFVSPESHFGQVDVNDLLSKLISTGIIPAAKPTQTDTTATTETESAVAAAPGPAAEEEEEEEQEVEEDVPDLTSFHIEDMKQRFDSVVTKLYTGIQCYSCGMRFTAAQTDVYADHLDWHYRQNRSEKDVSRKVTHRRWYYSLTDWIEFEEIADLEERAKSQFFEKENEEEEQKSQEAAREKEFQSVRATADVVGESCDICQEAFEMYWEEEEEEWHLKNAIRVDGKPYHPSCYEDYKNTSSFLDATPSPNKLLTENPLSAFVKREPEEDEVTSCDAAVKQEAEPEDGGAPDVKREQEEVPVEASVTPASAIS